MPRTPTPPLPAGLLAAAALKGLEDRHPLIDRLLPPDEKSVRIHLDTPMSVIREGTKPGMP